MSKRFLVAVIGAVVAIGGLGCMKNSSYAITPLEHEIKEGQLDATWFERAVWEKGEVVAVELVYCPMTPKANTVCRTAVVWRKNSSALMDSQQSTPPAPGGPYGTSPSR